MSQSGSSPVALKQGTSYKGFDVLSVTKIAEGESSGIYLRHRKTGLEVFHLFNTDKENLFAFALRTIPEDSSGAPHILEHSVFCGSEKYPLKDPFVVLMNQSVNTFMNALTYPDKTVFPASSMVKSDYFNLFSVYSDAVFFPLLRKETFEQEGFHLAVGNDGIHSIQGIVYSEMQGAYSSFETVMFNACFHSLVKGSVYENDSGGDPLKIPTLTYNRYKAFYEKYYRPDNCLLFLYGNIPTTDQLDFLQTDLLSRLEKKYPVSKRQNYSKAPVVSSAIRRLQMIQKRKAPETFYVKAPVSEESGKGSVVNMNWLISTNAAVLFQVECEILAEILTGHDGSPLTNALLTTNIGTDESPNTGLLSEINTIQFTIGLRNVKKGNEEKVRDYILSSLQTIYDEGISKDDIESALMSVGFSMREIVRDGGPYSLTLLDRVLEAWIYGKRPFAFLNYQDVFKTASSHFIEEPRYAEELLKKILLDDKNFSLVITTPDTEYTQRRENQENRIIAELCRNSSNKVILSNLNHLQKFQRRKETAKLPHIHLSDLDVKADNILIEQETLKSGPDSIPLFISREQTNGIIYLDVGFPCDAVHAEEYLDIPFYAVTAANIGWKGKSWTQSAREAALCCADLGVDMVTSSVPGCYLQSHRGTMPAYIGRDWIMFHVKSFDEKSPEALNILADCISGAEFTDVKRIRSLLEEYRNDIDSAVIPSGQSFALRRASCTLNRSKCISEIWKGLTQLFHIHKLSNEDIHIVSKKLARINEEVKKSGAVIHVTADDDGIRKIRPLLKDFIQKAELSFPSQNSMVSQEALRTYIFTGNELKNNIFSDEVFSIPAHVGFCASVTNASPFGTKASSAEIAAANWLSGSELWEKLRTIGGSYGSAALVDSVECLFSFITYRDPQPEKSKQVFLDCIRDAIRTELSDEDVIKIIIGTYSSEVQPRSAAAKGYTGFLRVLFGITEQDREKSLLQLVEVTGEDIKAACRRFYEAMKKSGTIILTGKELKNINRTGNIIGIPV